MIFMCVFVFACACRKISVLGGGYISVEFSGIFNRMGAEVHTAYRQPLPLRGFDEEVGQGRGQGHVAGLVHLGAGTCVTRQGRSMHGGRAGRQDGMYDI